MDYPVEKPYSVEDVAAMENHAELINDALVVLDRTSTAHNNAVVEISTALKLFIDKMGVDCKVFSENVALFCDELCDSNGNLFLPDVMTVCNKNGIKEDGVHTVPKFVAEVTSDSTKKQDYGRKMVTYVEMGVQEYWIVDIQRNVIMRYLTDNEFVPEVISYPGVPAVPVHTYPGLEINLSSIFEL